MSARAADADAIDAGRRPWPRWAKVIATLVIAALVIGSVFLVRFAVRFYYEAHRPTEPARTATPTGTGAGFAYPVGGAAPLVGTVSANAGLTTRPALTRRAGAAGQSDAITSPITGLGGGGGGAARVSTPPNPAQTEAASEAADDALARGLRATRLEGTKARELPDPTFLVTAGRLISCRLQTAMNTEHPGVIAAIVGNNVMGDTGTSTAIDGGSRLVGTVGQHQSATGVSTGYVLWQRIITPPIYDERGLPHEYSVEADSPATNEMGETGIEGSVDRHYRTKIPALIGISLLQALPSAAGAAVSAGLGSSGSNAIAVNLGQNGAQGVQSAADAWLGRILSQADTVRALVGSNHCALMTARDLDMNPIYQLKLRRRGAR